MPGKFVGSPFLGATLVFSELHRSISGFVWLAPDPSRPDGTGTCPLLALRDPRSNSISGGIPAVSLSYLGNLI